MSAIEPRDVLQVPGLMIVGAALMLVALPLPWAEAKALDRSAAVTGTELVVTAIWTVVIAVCLVLCWVGHRLRGSFPLGLLGLAGAISACAFAGTTILVANRLDGILGDALGESVAAAEPSTGLWLLLLGGLLGGVGASGAALRDAAARADARFAPILAARPPSPPPATPPPLPGGSRSGSDPSRGGSL